MSAVALFISLVAVALSLVAVFRTRRPEITPSNAWRKAILPICETVELAPTPAEGAPRGPYAFTPEQALRFTLFEVLSKHVPIDCAIMWIPRLETALRTGTDPGPQK